MKTKDIIDLVIEGFEMQSVSRTLGRMTSLLGKLERRAETYGEEELTAFQYKLFHLEQDARAQARVVDLLLYDQPPRVQEYRCDPHPELKAPRDLVKDFGFAWCDEEVLKLRFRKKPRKPFNLSCLAGRNACASVSALVRSVEAWGFRFATPYELMAFAVQYPDPYRRHRIVTVLPDQVSGLVLSMTYYDPSAPEDECLKRGSAVSYRHSDIWEEAAQRDAVLAVVRRGRR